MSYDIRAITEEELPAYCEAVVRGFGDEVREGEHDRVRRGIGLGRAKAAFDQRGRIVGTMGSYTMQLAVPGGVDVATAGLTRVTVATSHRRQGILRSLIDAHFDEAAEHGEALSILWASEAPIYGRFGYGPIGDQVALSWDARLAGIRPPEVADRVDLVDSAEAEKLVPELRERARRHRPGLFHRSALQWELRHFPDYEWMRHGRSPRRWVVAERDGQPVGYASYRQKEMWTDDDLPEGELVAQEVIGIDDRAMHSLWWFLSTVDLFPRVSCFTQPTDSLVPWLAANPRAVNRRLSDNIHLRVVDPVASLSARRYQQPGELVFALTDHQRPGNAGTYHLEVGEDGTGRCSPTDAEPSATISAYGLGSLFLGSGSPRPLAHVGHIDADDGAIRHLGRLLGWPVAAFCDEGF